MYHIYNTVYLQYYNKYYWSCTYMHSINKKNSAYFDDKDECNYCNTMANFDCTCRNLCRILNEYIYVHLHSVLLYMHINSWRYTQL